MLHWASGRFDIWKIPTSLAHLTYFSPSAGIRASALGVSLSALYTHMPMSIDRERIAAATRRDVGKHLEEHYRLCNFEGADLACRDRFFRQIQKVSRARVFLLSAPSLDVVEPNVVAWIVHYR